MWKGFFFYRAHESLRSPFLSALGDSMFVTGASGDDLRLQSSRYIASTGNLFVNGKINRIGLVTFSLSADLSIFMYSQLYQRKY